MQSVVALCHTVWANCECRRMGPNNLRGWCSASRPSWGCRGIIDTEMSFHQMGYRAELGHGCRYGVPKEFGNAGELSSSVFFKHDCNNNVLQISWTVGYTMHQLTTGTERLCCFVLMLCVKCISLHTYCSIMQYAVHIKKLSVRAAVVANRSITAPMLEVSDR